LFRKFCVDFADKYKTSPIQLTDDAKLVLVNYRWPGNIRELKNMAEQISVLAPHKMVNGDELRYFIPNHTQENMPMITGNHSSNGNTDFASERDILYKLFFDMKKDVNDLKKMFFEIVKNPALGHAYNPESMNNEQMMPFTTNELQQNLPASKSILISNNDAQKMTAVHPVEETLNLADHEREYIIKALKKHRSRRRDAASELGISERTLYRKIKEYDIEE
jgi:DNA-binding NtrC family response regulator